MTIAKRPPAEYTMTKDDWAALHALWKMAAAVCTGHAPREVVSFLAHAGRTP